MIKKWIENSRHKKYFKTADKVIEKAEALEDYTKEEIADKVVELRKNNGVYEEEELRIEAFALAYVAAERVLEMSAYRVQLYGAKVLTEGNVAEMKTGEGKTLVSVFSIVYEVLAGRKVHLITANEYLADRDRNEIGKVLDYLGISVGINKNSMNSYEKRQVYRNDVLYGTASEFGFDYLRDNMAKSLEEKVQSKLDFVLIDEADSILIDEARTPLIISGAKQEDLSNYTKAKVLVSRFSKKDYEIDLENNQIWLTDDGIEKAQLFWQVDNMYELSAAEYLRVTLAMIRAYFMMHKDRDYVVRGEKVEIIDGNTGRIMEGRRFSEGIHQCLEAKEGVKLNVETMTLATITIQNYFRMYQKIAGMTGTAKTEEEELQKIYGLDVITVPTNLPVIRADHNDEIYINEEQKIIAIVKLVKEVMKSKRPILVGTASIKENEKLSAVFTKHGIAHEPLSAKNHEREAEIIAKAGELGSVTLATNMAGRGTDIKINEEVRNLGGLFVLGTAKHDSRRIDNQLRGRSGRQGDPGDAKFIMSLDDELIKKFNGTKIKELAEKLKFPKEEAISHKMIVNSITKAQKRIEGANYDARKHLIEYDEVIDFQRKFIYKERDAVLKMDDSTEFTKGVIQKYLDEKMVELSTNEETAEMKEWVVANLTGAVEEEIYNLSSEEFISKIPNLVIERYVNKRADLDSTILSQIEKNMFLNILDKAYIDHLDKLVHLKEGIHLRSYAHNNPLTEYKNEASKLFEDVLATVTEQYALTAINYEITINQPNA